MGQPPTGAPGGNAMTGSPGGGPGGQGGSLDTATLDYLVANQGTATWIVAVSDATSAGQIELSTGRAVMAMGGFTGSDNALTLEQLQALVSSGDLRFVSIGGRRGGGGALAHGRGRLVGHQQLGQLRLHRGQHRRVSHLGLRLRRGRLRVVARAARAGAARSSPSPGGRPAADLPEQVAAAQGHVRQRPNRQRRPSSVTVRRGDRRRSVPWPGCDPAPRG